MGNNSCAVSKVCPPAISEERHCLERGSHFSWRRVFRLPPFHRRIERGAHDTKTRSQNKDSCRIDEAGRFCLGHPDRFQDPSVSHANKMKNLAWHGWAVLMIILRSAACILAIQYDQLPIRGKGCRSPDESHPG